jgi:DNA protecting protein DprA
MSESVSTETVGVDVEDLAALYALDSIKGFGPQKFKELHEAGLTACDVLDRPELLPIRGKRGGTFRAELEKLAKGSLAEFRARAERQIAKAQETGGAILTFADPRYPEIVYASNNPVHLLYVRGSLDVLTERRTVACVGSRTIRPPYSEAHDRFARLACEEGFTVVSGFALGADRIGHVAAWKSGGRTICVMPSGLDVPFPPENRPLWNDLLSYEKATMVSEFAFGTKAASLTLRKRNKLIVAFARGVLVSQSSNKGGAMNAFRFAVEQRKPVATFVPDGSDATSGNEAISRAGDAATTTISVDGELRTEALEWLRTLSSSI